MAVIAYGIIRLVVTIVVVVVTLALFAAKGVPSMMKDVKVHGALMIASFVVAMGVAITSYKNLPVSHTAAKFIHGTLNFIALVLMFAGFSVIYEFKEKSVPPKHFAMTHSWVGMLILVLVVFMYLFGGVAFNCFSMFPSEEMRRKLKPIHKYLGIGVFVLGNVNIAAGLCIYREMVVLESLVNWVSLLCILAMFVTLFTVILRKPVKAS